MNRNPTFRSHLLTSLKMITQNTCAPLTILRLQKDVKWKKDLFTKREVLDLVENHTNSKAVTDIILQQMFDLDACTVSDGENVEVERTKDIIRRRVDRLIATMKDKKMKLRVKRVSDMYLTITYLNRIYYLVDVLC